MEKQEDRRRFRSHGGGGQRQWEGDGGRKATAVGGRWVSSSQVADACKEFITSHNVVFGKVPEAIAQLQKVNLSHNRLCGQLPPTNFSASAFAGNACLCGAPLPPCKAA
nr:receptor-like protein 12 [Ipomoea batatas]